MSLATREPVDLFGDNLSNRDLSKKVMNIPFNDPTDFPAVKRNLEAYPELQLQLAVLEEAFNVMVRGDPKDLCAQNEAVLWFEDLKRNDEFSLVGICENFKFDPGVLRLRARKMYKDSILMNRRIMKRNTSGTKYGSHTNNQFPIAKGETV